MKEEMHSASTAVLSFVREVSDLRAEVRVLQAQRTADSLAVDNLGQKVDRLIAEVAELNKRQHADELPGIRVTWATAGVIASIVFGAIGLIAMFRG